MVKKYLSAAAPATAHELGLADTTGVPISATDAGASASAAVKKQVSSQDVMNSISSAYRSRPSERGYGVGAEFEESQDPPPPSTYSPHNRRKSSQTTNGRKGGGIMREANHADNFLKGKKGSTVQPYKPYKM